MNECRYSRTSNRLVGTKQESKQAAKVASCKCMKGSIALESAAVVCRYGGGNERKREERIADLPAYLATANHVYSISIVVD